MVYKSGVYTKLFVDGILTELIPSVKPMALTFSGADLGAWQFAEGNWDRHGALDLHGFRIWAGERDGKDSCPEGGEDDLLVMFGFDECVGDDGIIKDMANHGNDASLISGTLKAVDAMTSCGVDATPPPSCDSPASLKFDGDNDYVSLNGPLSDSVLNHFSLELWMTMHDVTSLQSIFTDGLYDTDGDLQINLVDGTLRFAVSGAGEVDFQWR